MAGNRVMLKPSDDAGNLQLLASPIGKLRRRRVVRGAGLRFVGGVLLL
jgi:hypothetical protein